MRSSRYLRAWSAPSIGFVGLLRLRTPNHKLTLDSVLLHFQVLLGSVDGPSHDWVGFVVR